MEFGIGYIPTHDALAPGTIARLVEERGLESLFLCDRPHIPVSFVDAGAAVSHVYRHTYDVFVAVTDAVAATSRIRVGTGICVITERDPIMAAKATASIDRLSGGRFEFGVGAGWIPREMANHGIDPHARMRVMRERVEAIRAIWTEDKAAYHGEFVDFDPIYLWPKPAQRPHPPVLVGGNGPRVLDRVLAFGDAWFPEYDDDVIERAAELRGRADRQIDLVTVGVPADAAVLERLRDAGFRRALHWIPSGNRSVVERELEVWESAIGQANGVA